MTDYAATRASDEAYTLGEGPVWDPERRRVLWVDIVEGTVFEGRIEGSAIFTTRRHQFDQMVGAVVPAVDGSLLVAGQEELIVIDPSGERRVADRIVPPGIRSRTNDGAVDPAGRFLIGTLSLDDRSGEERLLRVDGGLTVIDDDLQLSNGLAWSPDGGTLYSIDTGTGTIWARPYDAPSGAVGARTEYLHVSDGSPDGMCADVDGNLWVAIWGAGEVRCYTADGTVIHRVRVPAPHVSSVAFIGPRLRMLLITTSRRDLSREQLLEHPDAGLLFTVVVDAAGVPTTPWSAATADPA
jgi:sugar lactone lactonase YvrE